jgi:hypothetical protein
MVCGSAAISEHTKSGNRSSRGYEAFQGADAFLERAAGSTLLGELVFQDAALTALTVDVGLQFSHALLQPVVPLL